ncbi:MAG: glutamine--fructose-6-phosphate transaminase (isomerizing) [Bdellovibrio sp.]|nr:glutamine--fructose-6-phosphate transaminase (isomerizing) [Bdellovibrio sp.]
MCGIVGYVGQRKAVDVLIPGLQRLEYRGYDSAGIALQVEKGIEIKKSEGRLENVERLLNGSAESLQKSHTGMGHTRWATHGKPTTQNAHPHKTGHVVLVHNGIIENYLDLKRDILTRGHKPVSETDSELFGYLVLDEMDKGANLAEAVRKSFVGLHGQCSMVVMSEKEPGVIIGVRNGSPLVAAVDPQGGAIIASDAQAAISYTKDIFFLDHGEMVIATNKGLVFEDLKTGKTVKREPVKLDWSVDKMNKGGFPHYMLKEIHEQPVVLVDTLNALLDRNKHTPFPLSDQPAVRLLENARQLIFVACGTSWHAASIGKYWIESLAKIPVSVELASEFRYRDAVLPSGTVVIGVSQSGETADTLAVLRDLKTKKIPTIGICNVRGSSISREADAVFYTSAGPEIGVAATKTFSSQLLVIYLIAGYMAHKSRATSDTTLAKCFEDLVKVPHILSDMLEPDSSMVRQVTGAVDSVKDAKGFFFIGRGTSFPMALEGALKLKEISYDYAEGYAAGELKHGPIAMIDLGMVVVVLAPKDLWRDKTVSNLEEVKARGATILGIGDTEDHDLKTLCDLWVGLPKEGRALEKGLLPFLLSPIVQLLSYHRAVYRGTDVDKPRNLAKSVTVE